MSNSTANLKVNEYGQLVKIVKRITEDGTVIEVEETVSTTALGQVVRDKNGVFVESKQSSSRTGDNQGK